MRHSKKLKQPRQLPCLIIFGISVCVGAITAYAFSDVEARYIWREWHAPTLALALDRGDAPLAMGIGNTYFGTTLIGIPTPRYDLPLAARAFRKALAIKPGILWGHYSLARIAFAKGDFATSLTEIQAELAANPENLRSLYIRGLIYGYRGLPGDLALSEGDFRSFTLWAPTEWAGYNDLSWILLKEGKYNDTLAVLERAFAEVPDASQNPWLQNDRGLAFLNLGENAQARSAFQTALDAANALTSADWRRAYTGDAPANDTSGLAAFRAGITENLAKASGHAL